MSRVSFVSRADDLGSSRSANQAIKAVLRAGFIKNTSIMAPCSFVKEAAELLAGNKNICFGMHTTLNAEWDRVKWKPITSLGKESGLVDDNGYFLADPEQFLETKPPLEVIMREVNAQLEYLHSLGFDIKYIDSHMLPERCVDGLDDAMKEFAVRKGLVDHMYFYQLPPDFEKLLANPKGFASYFKNLPDGQYFIACHPAFYSDETLLTGNATFKGEDIAKGRDSEAKIFSGKALNPFLRVLGTQGIRYDEAKPGERLTMEQAKKFMGK